MNRDSFWENIRDMFFLVLKLIIVLSLIQGALLLFGSEIKIPVVYGYMMQALKIWRETSTSFQSGT